MNPYNKGLLRKILAGKSVKVISIMIALEIVIQSINPMYVMALTSGPSQPEVEGFKSIGTTEMVDPFTGDFSYNIPLMEIGGYPLNLAYQSGVTQEDEASWAGLGWNVHTGAISRQMRGLPDDFWDDEITRKVHMRDNVTYGAKIEVGWEVFGFEASNAFDQAGINLSVGTEILNNTYTGFGLTNSTGAGFGPSGEGSKSPLTANLDFSAGPDGLNINPSMSFTGKIEENFSNSAGKSSIGFGVNLNSRAGLTGMSFSYSVGNQKQRGFGTTSFIGFGQHTYTPQISLPMTNSAASGRFKIGGAVYGQDIDFTIRGFGAIQKLSSEKLVNPSYGYIYSEQAANNPDAIHDFNREKDGSYTKETNNLPLTNYTYDIYSISAQGLSGSFRPHRNAAGYIYDNVAVSPSTSLDFGAELNVGNLGDIGIDFKGNFMDSKTGPWVNSNGAADKLGFKGKELNKIPESFHFKMMGETNVDSDPAFRGQLKGNDAVRFELSNPTSSFEVHSLPIFVNKDNESLDFEEPKRSNRENRNTAIYHFTKAEVLHASPWKEKYISDYAKDHHIAEIVVIQPDGKRYVFGLAAYNTMKKEITFNVGKGFDGSLVDANSASTGLVNYINQSNIAFGKKRGIDHYYEENETPAYAHSWMLTEVLSPDYVDVTGDGPTADDLGQYVKFNYGKTVNGEIVPDVQNYKWRTPVAGFATAAYMEGLKSDIRDDKANIIYGEKDVWFVNSIESKNQIAIFETKDRTDARGVNIDGSTDYTKALKQIDKIKLYSKQEYDANMATAVPLKTAHFKYEDDDAYKLCGGAANSPGGKLTLKEVYFTYQNSNEGRFSPYKFEYIIEHPVTNEGIYSYNYGQVDRWGIKKRDYELPSATLNHTEYPYAVQDEESRDRASSIFHLNQIKLPSGGQINVEYESDDYAYVQDKAAMRMFKIVGLAKDAQGEAKPNTFSTFNQNGMRDYLIVDLGETLEDSEEFRDRYLKGYGAGNPYQQNNDHPNQLANNPLKKLYFRFMMNVNNGNQAKNNPDFEYISGYVDIDGIENCGLRSNNSSHAYIKIKQVGTKFGAVELNVSPFAFAAWQFSRIFTPKKAYNQAEYDDIGIVQFAKTILTADLITQLIQFFRGPNRRMMQEGFGNRVDTDRSWVRLLEPDKNKLGGGNRVKELTISDGWSEMSPTEASATYGQQFIYNDENGVSYGVAAYEPGIGADENALRMPVGYNGAKQLLIPQDRFYLEEPFGESFFPAPIIGYSKVIVRDMSFDSNVKKNRTGKTEYEFYTAKDFPITTERTAIKPRPKKSNILGQLFRVNYRNYMTVSQGYSITVNDMHGKPKSVSMFAEGQPTPFAYTKYNYKQKAGTTTERVLDNEAPVIYRDGLVREATIGTDVDFVGDMREHASHSKIVNAQLNLSVFLVGFFPIPVFSLFGGFSQEKIRFRSAVGTKVISQYGIQESVETYDKGAHVKTEVEAFDALTGNPVLKKMNNEFQDKYYALDYPAHWSYTGMRQASENIGYLFSHAGSGPLDQEQHQYLEPGDEVLKLALKVGGHGGSGYHGNANTLRLWVARDVANNNDLYLINAQGLKYQADSEGENFQIIRSGHRNMQSMSIGSATSMVLPVSDNGSNSAITFDGNSKVINASALEYAEQWRTRADFAKFSIDTVCNSVPQVEALIQILNRVNNIRGTVFTHDYGVPQGGPVNLGNDYIEQFNTLTTNEGCDINTIYTSTNGSPNVHTNVIPWACYPYAVLSNTYGFWGGLGCRCKYTVCVPDPPAAYHPPIFGTGGVVTNNLWTNISHFTGNFFFNTNYTYPSAPNNALALEVKMNNGSTTNLLYIVDCIEPQERICEYVTKYNCSYNVGDIVNPYLYGILGNWRPKTDYYFAGNRNNTDPSTAENLRHDGYIPGYIPFWTPDILTWNRNAAVNLQAYENWTQKNEITVYSPYGFDLENKNLLPAYSSSAYGYQNTLPIAVTLNAMHKEIGYDGFEDYYPNTPLPNPNCGVDHFKFESYRNKLSNEQSHTGIYSIKMNNSEELVKTVKLSPAYQSVLPHTLPYVLQTEDMLSNFSPNSDEVQPKRYVYSFWTKYEDRQPTLYTYDGIQVQAQIGASVLVAGSLKKSKIINDWQRIEVMFDVSGTAGSELKLIINNTSGKKIFIDDIRVHPFDANMKTYVFNAVNNRYMAQLDENNFATFYEYDEGGSLIRVKKETERGIVTIQENKTHLYKK